MNVKSELVFLTLTNSNCQSKTPVNKELSGLDEQKVSLEYMNRIKEKVDNADGIVSIYEEVKNETFDFWEIWIFDTPRF